MVRTTAPATPWSVERVVAELRQLHAGGVTISYSGLRGAGYGALVTAAERYAGSFARAVRLAGLEPARPLWTRARVIAEIRRLHREGVALGSERLCKDGHAGMVQAGRRAFGSWPDAVTAAGAPPYKRGAWKSWGQIRDRLRELHRGGARMTIAALEELGHADLVAAARASAGGWNAALARAGIPRVQEHRAWSARQVLDEIGALDRAGVPLGSKLLIARGHRKLVKAATHYFGGWREACRRAVPAYRPLVAPWTVDRLLAAIRARHRRGVSVRSTDVEKEEPVLTAAARRLGIRWRDACRRAGVPARAIAPRAAPTRVRWNEGMIAAELRAAARAGRPLLTRSFPGGFVGAVLRRYPSWRGAVAAAGLARRYDADLAAAHAGRLGGATLRAVRAR